MILLHLSLVNASFRDLIDIDINRDLLKLDCVLYGLKLN